MLTNEIFWEIKDLRNSQKKKKNLDDSLMKFLELKYFIVLNYDMYLALS